MLPDSVRRVVRLLTRLPGVGQKTAQRYGLQLCLDPAFAAALGRELLALGEQVGACVQCGNLAERQGDEAPLCHICRSTDRDDGLLCVVGRMTDLLAIERSGVMRGRYFVLGTLLSPLEGIGPEQLPLERLRAHIAERNVREVLLATPPSVDGEATALFLARELQREGITVSRIASGVPHGGDLEYTDQVTLGRAIEGRRSVG